MTRVRSVRWAFARLALGAFVAACDGPGSKSFVRFDHSGVAAGSFSTVGGGAIQGMDLLATSAPVVAGWRDCGDGGAVLVAATGPSNVRMVVAIGFTCDVIGSLNISAGCSTLGGHCAEAIFSRGDIATESYEYSCDLETGSVVLTANEKGHLAGTFSGAGACTMANSTTSQSVSITNGTFDARVSSPYGT